MSAEVTKVGKGDVEAVAGVVTVRLNGLFQRWPMWGHTLLAVASIMSNTKAYINKARKGSSALQDSMTVRLLVLRAVLLAATQHPVCARSQLQRLSHLRLGCTCASVRLRPAV